jgi:transcriptional regulator with XRE-family HTH domain/predicted RNase H-like HicB family nuclease
MQYTALITKAGKQTLAEFPGCPGCQTFADPGEDILARAEEALTGWLEAHLVSGQAPPEPTTVRSRGRARAVQIPVPAKLAVTLAVRWARLRAGISQAELARRAGLSQPVVARLENPDHNATVATLERVAAALGTRLDVGLQLLSMDTSSRESWIDLERRSKTVGLITSARRPRRRTPRVARPTRRRLA